MSSHLATRALHLGRSPSLGVCWPLTRVLLLEIIGENTDKVAGVKMSLLDADAEVSVRERLPESVRMFTGDDFNYVGLIGGTDMPDVATGDVSSGSARSTTGEAGDGRAGRTRGPSVIR